MPPTQQAQPPNQAVDFNAGINLLPGQGAEMPDYPSLAPEGPVQTAPPPTAVPSAGGWNTDPSGNLSKAPSAGGWSTDPNGNLINTPSAGGWNINQYGGLNDPGLFHRLLNSIFGGVGDLAQSAVGGVGGLGGLFSRFHPFQGGPRPAPPRPAPAPTGFNRTSFQTMFPGSAIGPLSGARNNPFQTGSRPVVGAGSMAGISSPAYATAFSNVVNQRNII